MQEEFVKILESSEKAGSPLVNVPKKESGFLETRKFDAIFEERVR